MPHNHNRLRDPNIKTNINNSILIKNRFSGLASTKKKNETLISFF